MFSLHCQHISSELQMLFTVYISSQMKSECTQAARAIYLINQVIVADRETPLHTLSLSLPRTVHVYLYLSLSVTLLMLGHLLCE